MATTLYPLTILTFDPGGTTGWAMLKGTGEYDEEANLVEIHDFQITCGQIAEKDHHSQIQLLIETNYRHKTYVICESFKYRNASRYGLDMSAVEYIGIIKLICKDLGIEYSEQSPSQAKGFVPDAKIRSLDLWYPSNRHAMDAIRHMIFALVNKWPKLGAIRTAILKVAYNGK